MNVEAMRKVELTSSSISKKSYLRGLDDITKRAIQYALDPFMTFGITVDELPIGDLFSLQKVGDPKEWWLLGFELMDALCARTYTGYRARDLVRGWLSKAPDGEHAKWGMRVLNKDLRCGVSIAIALSVWPGLVEQFSVSLAQPYEGEALGPGWIEPKLDGIRMVIIDGVALSRGGHLVQNVQHIIDHMSSLNLLNDYVWDGECLDPSASFEATSGSARNTNTDGGMNLVFHPFDLVQRGQWRLRRTNSLNARKEELMLLAPLVESDCVRPIIGEYVSDPTNALMIEQRDKFMAQGFEGSMYKDAYSMYQFKRSDAMLKFKKFETMDAKIVDVEEGRGKYVGVLGALVVEADDVRFNVGSGYTDNERTELWNLRETLLGKTVEVKYQNKTNHGKGRFPIYIRMRPDKD